MITQNDLGPDASLGEIGTRRERTEDLRLLTGRGCFVADIALPHMLHAAFVRSVFAHTRIIGIDTARALELPGVVAVLTGDDFPPATLIDGNLIPGLRKTPQPALASGKARFVGEALAIVLAEDRYIAEDAAELVDVEYDPLPVVTRPGDQPPGHVPIHDEFTDDIIYDEEATFGDPEGAWAQVTHVFSKDFELARSMAAPIEGRGAVARFDPASGLLDVWASTQSPHLLRRKLAMATGIAEHHVKVIMHDVGGAFGQKIAAQPEELAVALAAIAVGATVKWVEDRRENFLAAPHARDVRITLEIGTDAGGHFLAMRANVLGDVGAYSFNSASGLIESYLTARTIPGVYKVPNYSYRVTAFLTNKSPVAPYRGVGFVAAQAARELLIDEVARDLGIDRLELRQMNMIGPEEFPFQTCTGLLLDSGSYQESMKRAGELIGYQDFLGEQSVLRDEGRYLGLGISPYIEPGGWGSEGMEQLGWHSFPSNDSARVSMDLDGKVTIAVGTPSQGQGIETTLAQVASDVLGVPFADVRVNFGDTSSAPISLAGTRASRAAVISGGAVGLAAADLRQRVLQVASLLLETDPQYLTIHAGFVRAAGSTAEGVGTSLSVADVVQKAFQMKEVRRILPEPNFDVIRFYDPGASYSNACVVAVVEVDPEIGQVRVLRLLGVEDCGTVINPMIVEAQFAGGAVQGIGCALLERLAYDPVGGEPQTTSFMDYLLPTSDGVPAIEVHHLISPSPFTWRGIKGVGESASIGVPAAIAAALADALAGLRPGARVSALPMLPEDVFQLING